MFKYIPIIALPLLLLNACSTTPSCNSSASDCGAPNPGPSAYNTKARPIAPLVLTRPAKLTAIGYGATPTSEAYTPGQRRLLAMRASKLDAYRALTEEVYGVRITSNSTVSALISQNDSFRAYVDTYLRGAKVLTVTPLADGNYETVMELEISDQFYDDMNQPRLASYTQSSNCGVKGVVSPGCTYGAGFYHAE